MLDDIKRILKKQINILYFEVQNAKETGKTVEENCYIYVIYWQRYVLWNMYDIDIYEVQINVNNNRQVFLMFIKFALSYNSIISNRYQSRLMGAVNTVLPPMGSEFLLQADI